MTRLFIYLLVFGILLYLMSSLSQKTGQEDLEKTGPSRKSKSWFKPKPEPGETWLQVYETASPDEARTLRARLQEEEIDCIVYEQGKKDIHGNAMKGYGVAVPKIAAAHSQSVISRSLS